MKPKVCLNPKDTAAVAYEAAVGGVDLIKDDETLTNQRFCPLMDRLAAVMDALERAEQETGRTVLYALNVTTGGDAIVEAGANMLMVDVLTAGFSAVQALAADPAITVPIHVHRTMHGALTRNPHHGIALRPIAKLVRLCGGDQLHTGMVSGKMGGSAAEIRGDNTILTESWGPVAPVFPVASGGLHPGKVHAELAALGTEIVLQAGGVFTVIRTVPVRELRRCVRRLMRSLPVCWLRSMQKPTRSLPELLRHGERHSPDIFSSVVPRRRRGITG